MIVLQSTIQPFTNTSHQIKWIEREEDKNK